MKTRIKMMPKQFNLMKDFVLTKWINHETEQLGFNLMKFSQRMRTRGFANLEWNLLAVLILAYLFVLAFHLETIRDAWM